MPLPSRGLGFGAVTRPCHKTLFLTIRNQNAALDLVTRCDSKARSLRLSTQNWPLTSTFSARSEGLEPPTF